MDGIACIIDEDAFEHRLGTEYSSGFYYISAYQRLQVLASTLRKKKSEVRGHCKAQSGNYLASHEKDVSKF